MKILEIIPQLSSGGGERFTVDLCNELSRNGHDVTLVILHKLTDKTGFYQRDLDDKIKVVVMDKRMGFDWKLMFRIRNLIKTQRPDVVHTHLRAIMYIMLSVLTDRSVMYCHTVHNAARQEAGSGIDRLVRKLSFKRKWVTPITISGDSHRSFVDFYRMDAPMIANGRNIPNEITVTPSVRQEMNAYQKTPKTRILVQLARLDAVKRQPLMARVAKRLSDEGFDFSLLMIGRKNNALVEEINDLHCPAVHVLGEKHNALEYLTMADAYCLCSSYEGMPISLIEALGTYTVPVCTPVGGIVNAIKNGKNGFLSKDLNEESYYQTLKQFLLLDDEQLSEMKLEARESYKAYSMTECGAKYEALFKVKKHNSINR